MTELILKLKKKKFEKRRKLFAQGYRHCNHCEKHLNIKIDEEIICAICGETFCKSCITNHQKCCY